MPTHFELWLNSRFGARTLVFSLRPLHAWRRVGSGDEPRLCPQPSLLWLKVPETRGRLAQRRRSAGWPCQRSLGLLGPLVGLPHVGMTLSRLMRKPSYGTTHSSSLLRQYSGPLSASPAQSVMAGSQMAPSRSASSRHADEIAPELTLVYITLPVVQLVSLSLVSLKVTEPMGDVRGGLNVALWVDQRQQQPVKDKEALASQTSELCFSAAGGLRHVTSPLCASVSSSKNGIIMLPHRDVSIKNVYVMYLELRLEVLSTE